MDRSMGLPTMHLGASRSLGVSRGACGSRAGQVPAKRQASFDSIPGAGTLKAIFLEHDADKSGEISKDELTVVLNALLPDLPEHKMSLLFEQIDVNHDGQIQYEEFIDWLMDGGIGPVKGNETWYTALEAILTQGLFLTETGLCGRWSLKRKKKNKSRETYSLLSCGVVSYSKHDCRYSGGTCSVDREEVTGFGEWNAKEGVLTLNLSVHVEIVSGSGVHVDRLVRDENRLEQWTLPKFETLFSRTGVLDGEQEVRTMLAMFGELFSESVDRETIIRVLGDAGGHTGKAAYLVHKRSKEISLSGRRATV